MIRYDLGKLLVLLSIIAATTVLAALHVISDALVTNVLMGTLGYVIGNGALAVRGKAPSPAISDAAAIVRTHLDEALAANVAADPEAEG